MKRSWQRVGHVSTHRRAQPVSVPFHFSFQHCRDFSTSPPTPLPEVQDVPFTWRAKNNQLSLSALKMGVMQEREEKLSQSVETAYSDHAKIFGQYLADVNDAEGRPLPLEVHQAALRTCAPSPDEIRPYMARLMQEDKHMWNKLGHPFESRFRRIINNITDAGFDQSIEDYHFIMSQFAAVGHYVGIQNFTRRMGRKGLEPDQRTYGFLLQAIAHRISLSSPTRAESSIISQLVYVAVQALQEMVGRRMPPSTMNLDLALRILSEVHDLRGLAEFLRLGYGIDLSYLDSPPIDAAPGSSTLTLRPSPFSTSALNALLEALGRWGEISKMVYAFETLTNPLPVPAKPDNTFDDDDDDFLPIQEVRKPPFAKPNTTSFNTLIKYCVAHGYPALAKHYATQLMREEHMSTIRLREELRHKPLGEVAPPRLAVNVKTLRPIQVLASRNHKVGLLRWVIRVCKLSARRKYRAWTYYDQVGWKYGYEPASSTPDTLATPKSSPSPPSSPKTSRSPRFNIPTHQRILRHDVATLCDLKRMAQVAMFKTLTGTKARLGRRVWKGKDVYSREKGARVVVDRETWKRTVNFMESKGRWTLRPRVKRYLGKHFDPVIADIGPAKP